MVADGLDDGSDIESASEVETLGYLGGGQGGRMAAVPIVLYQDGADSLDVRGWCYTASALR